MRTATLSFVPRLLIFRGLRNIGKYRYKDRSAKRPLGSKRRITGEISAAMLSELNVSYAIIGHSERRQYFGETDDTVNSRVKAVISQGIIPIICVGESYGQREAQEPTPYCQSR